MVTMKSPSAELVAHVRQYVEQHNELPLPTDYERFQAACDEIAPGLISRKYAHTLMRQGRSKKPTKFAQFWNAKGPLRIDKIAFGVLMSFGTIEQALCIIAAWHRKRNVTFPSVFTSPITGSEWTVEGYLRWLDGRLKNKVEGKRQEVRYKERIRKNKANEKKRALEGRSKQQPKRDCPVFR